MFMFLYNNGFYNSKDVIEVHFVAVHWTSLYEAQYNIPRLINICTLFCFLLINFTVCTSCFYVCIILSKNKKQ